jgi:glucan-binding YG repeat protein
MKKLILKKAMVLSMVGIMSFGSTLINANASTSNNLSGWNNQWKLNDGDWNYIINGQKATGLQKINGKNYYFTSDGKIANGWAQVGNDWTYTCNKMNTIQPLITGWTLINDKWYYFNSDGFMVHDTTIDGYYLGSDGVWEK